MTLGRVSRLGVNGSCHGLPDATSVPFSPVTSFLTSWGSRGSVFEKFSCSRVGWPFTGGLSPQRGIHPAEGQFQREYYNKRLFINQ
jgi:hypothetical protein